MPTEHGRVVAIWAEARDRVIGDGDGMPWHIPDDLRFFKESTLGGACVMGRATWEAIPERFRPFPGRRTIVCTRDESYSAPGAEIARGVPEAIALAGDDDCYICGGGQIYAEALPLATACVVTEIDAVARGDVRAPALDPADWERVETGEWITDPRSRVDGHEGPVRHRFTRWERR